MRPELTELEEYYHPYLALAQGNDAIEVLENNLEEVVSFYESLSEEQGDYAYQEGKWTVKDVLQHSIDTERIFTCRALSFARGETQSLPGFDQGEFAIHAHAISRSIHDLLEEFSAVRESTIQLYYSFTPEMLARKGVGGNNQVTVNGYAFIIAGHYNHHIQVVKEKYLKQ